MLKRGGGCVPGKKRCAARSRLPNGYYDFLRILDIVSIFIVLIDRERRRSIYDMAARTVVVVGEPAEEEPETARQPQLGGCFVRAVDRAGGGPVIPAACRDAND